MNKIMIKMLALVTLMSFVITVVYADETDYKTWKLPQPGEYDGGIYPRWAPVEFTYKQYDGPIPLVSQEYLELIKENPTLACSLMGFLATERFPAEINKFIWEGRPDQIEDEDLKELLENDLDILYMMSYFFPQEKLDKDTVTRKDILRKGASRGHVMSRLSYLMVLGGENQRAYAESMKDVVFEEDEEYERTYKRSDNYKKAEELGEVERIYIELTPFAAWIQSWDIFDLYNMEEIAWMLENSGELIYLAHKLIYGMEKYHNNDKHEIKQRIPNYEDYLCETLYRGCWDELYIDDLVCK